MRVILDISEQYQGQLRFLSDDYTFRQVSGIADMLSDDCHIINQDRAYEAASKVAENFNLEVTDRASERIKELVDSTPQETPSFKTPFDGFQWKRYQCRAINVLRHEPNCMLQLSCGTGKTLISIFMACQRFDAGEADKIVVFCPSALVTDWVNEFKRATTLQVGTVNKNASPAVRKDWYYEANDVWVLNYERVRTSDYEVIMERLKSKKVIYIFDEVQKLANRKSALHKNIRKLVVKSAGRIALTATPILTGPENYYNEFRIIDPEVFGTVANFEELFTIGQGAKDIFGKYYGYRNLPYMHLITGQQVFSANKNHPEIAVEFPSKQEVLLPYMLSGKMQVLYDEIYCYGQSLEFGVRCGTLFLLTFTRLCNMPQLLLLPHEYDDTEFGQQYRDIDAICRQHEKDILAADANRKLELVKQKVDEIVGCGEKMVIFAAQTNNCLIPLSEALAQYNPLLYIGGQSAEEHDAIKVRFKGEGHNLLLMSDAGQVGLNFQECRYLLHYQTPTSHAAYEQRSDRIHRVDSDYDSVTIYRLMAEGTVEERIENIMHERKSIAVEMGLDTAEYEEMGAISMEDADYICGFM